MIHGPAGLVQSGEVVRLHGAQVEDLVGAVPGAAPWRRGEEDGGGSVDSEGGGKFAGAVEHRVEVVEAVAVDPGDLAADAVEVGVVLGAGEGRGVLLDGDDLSPLVREGKGNDVAAGAGEEVDDGGLGSVPADDVRGDIAVGAG